jgi:hypothetical protein
VLHCLTGFDQQALSNGFAQPSYFLELNGAYEQHPDAGLSTKEQAVARRSVITGAPLSTTKAAKHIDNLLASERNPKPFGELVYPIDLGQ